MRPLEFGWYLPTHGDTTAYGLPEAQVPGSVELCDRVVQAAEAAGFEYLLIPVGSVCWEAWIAGAFMAARSGKIKPLIAARPGYINPVLMAKMISTFDQMSGGRICINLIAGQNESEVEAEGDAAVQVDEEPRLLGVGRAAGKRPETPRVVTVGRLDLDNLSPEVSEQLRAVRPRDAL